MQLSASLQQPIREAFEGASLINRVVFRFLKTRKKDEEKKKGITKIFIAFSMFRKVETSDILFHQIRTVREHQCSFLHQQQRNCWTTFLTMVENLIATTFLAITKEIAAKKTNDRFLWNFVAVWKKRKMIGKRDWGKKLEQAVFPALMINSRCNIGGL